jgi:hypothetical protein
MRRLLIIVSLALAPAVSAGAQTLSTRDVIELSKAGLGEDVLLALIDVNRSVFPVDRETLKSLKDAGVPATVIVAMVRSGRELIEPPPEPPQPQVEVPEQLEPADVSTPRERELERELERAQDRERELERSRSGWYSSQSVVPVAVPVYVPVPVQRRPQLKPQEPVYWGWDGKRRPDSWDPAPVKDGRDRRDPNDASVPRGTLTPGGFTVPRAPGGGR